MYIETMDLAYADHGELASEREAARLFTEHSAWLLRYCRRQLETQSDAEDAVQTTFLYALRALRRGVEPEREEAWLTTIARNVCLAQRRAGGRQAPTADDVDLDGIALGAPVDGERELLMGLKSALASLPESQRRALVLREWQGVPSSEIAARMRLSPAAAHALVSRARRSLARALTAPRALAGFDLSFVLSRIETVLRALAGGAPAKAVAATVAAGVLLAGAPERVRQPVSDRPAATPTIVAPQRVAPAVTDRPLPFRPPASRAPVHTRVGTSVPASRGAPGPARDRPGSTDGAPEQASPPARERPPSPAEAPVPGAPAESPGPELPELPASESTDELLQPVSPILEAFPSLPDPAALGAPPLPEAPNLPPDVAPPAPLPDAGGLLP